MIHKSYLVEDNIDAIQNKLVLIYGENIGLINDLKVKIIKKHKGNKILRFYQEDLFNNQDKIYDEINNNSLFEDKKIIFIDNVNDKILSLIEDVLTKLNNNFIYLFSDLLEKKSKLRNFFEKRKELDIVPCYNDKEITLEKIIRKKLIGCSGLTKTSIDIIIENCTHDRNKINNEINKIKTYFYNKPINIEDVIKLINFRENEDFSEIRDTSISGKKNETNNLLGSTNIQPDKTFYYLSLMNLRFIKLITVLQNKESLEKSINNLKPPIFWKDKPIFINQAKLWDIRKLKLALKNSYEVEIKLKANSDLNKSILLKKYILDICNLASAA